MASYLVQSGTSLYQVSRAGVATAITLPTGITLYGSSQPCRAVLFGATASPALVVVNGANHDFWIDLYGTARPLGISSPIAAPTLAAGASTGLTGVYAVACTFKIKDTNGITVYETGVGPISSGSAALANTSLLMTKIPVSGDALVNARGLYRTLSGGNTLYPWFDIDNNVTLSADRGVADSLLSLLPTTATRNGVPPDLKLLISWQDCLWGVARSNPDFVNWTESRRLYGWSADNQLIVPPQRTDDFGVTAFIPRKDQLGIARLDKLYQITGFSNDTYQRTNVSESIGCVSQESVVVVRNVAYFLGQYGLVEWGPDGIGYVSEEQVDGWFNSDTFFNRALFSAAQGRYNPDTDSYELLLASVGSSNLDRWVSYSLRFRSWYGPHKTDAFTPACFGRDSSYQGILRNASNLPIAVMGSSDGFLYKRDATATDDTAATAVAVDSILDLPFLSGEDADYTQVWLEPTVHVKPQAAGTLVITPTVGEIDAVAGAPLSRNLALDRERLGRLGSGRYCQLSLRHAAVGEGVQVRGIEIPYVTIGRR